MTVRSHSPAAPSRRNQATRRAILGATLELVQAVGHSGMTIEAIASGAGVGKQTIYRWWSSKGAVLCEALLEPDSADKRDTTELPDSGDLETDLKNALRSTAAELTDPRRSEALRGLTAEAVLNPALRADYSPVLDRPGKHAIHRRLRSTQDAGQLVPDTDLDTVVDLLWGPLRQRRLHREGPLTTSFTGAVVHTTLKGLGPPHT